MLSDGTWNYGYDAAGNTVSKVNIATGETWTYGYDFNNRMTSAVDRTAGGALIQQVNYQYDVFGNLLSETVTAADGMAATTNYAYDRGKVWAALGADGALQTRYLCLDGADQTVAQVGASGAVGWYLKDHLGSVRDVVNDAGVVLDHIDYDAFGNITNETNPAQAPLFGFQGMRADRPTGLYFTWYRVDNPEADRWMQRDPSQTAAGDANFYRVTANDPVNLTDPTGLLVPAYEIDGLIALVTAGTSAGSVPIGGSIGLGVLMSMEMNRPGSPTYIGTTSTAAEALAESNEARPRLVNWRRGNQTPAEACD